jgi:hypothetical protein
MRPPLRFARRGHPLEHMTLLTSVNGRIVVTFAGLLIKVELMPGSEWLILPLAPGRAT